MNKQPLLGMWKKLAPLFGLVMLTPLAAMADWQSYPPSSPNHFVNPRPAGMGEAFTAVADDQNALYYNPAGLAKLGSWSIDYLEILSPLVGISGYDINAFNDVTAAQKTLSNFGSLMKDDAAFQDFRKFLGKLKGNPYYIRQALNPFFVGNFGGHGVGFGLYENLEFSTSFHESNTLIHLESTIDTDARVGYAHKVLGDKLSLGGALAFRVRGNVDFNLQLDQIGKYTGSGSDWWKKELKTGQSVLADTGLLFTPIETWAPTFGLAILNVSGSHFSAPSYTTQFSSKVPAQIPQSVNVGFSLTPRFPSVSSRLFTRAAVDFRDINLPTSASQKLRFGLEGGFERLFTLQAGLANNALSGGFELKLFILNLRYATYVEERGYTSGQKPERRHLINAKVLL